MSEFVLVVVLTNLIILVCMYLLRHLIAIRAPVLFIAVGISIILCILYPFLAAWVSYPQVIYLYAALVLAGAGVLYKIENTLFAATDITRGEMAEVAVGEALAAVEGGPALGVDRGIFQGFVVPLALSRENAEEAETTDTPPAAGEDREREAADSAGGTPEEGISVYMRDESTEAASVRDLEPHEITFTEEVPVEISEVEVENETQELTAGAPEFALEEPDRLPAETERPDAVVEEMLGEISASLLLERAEDEVGGEAPAGIVLEESEADEFEAGDFLAAGTHEEAEADPFDELAVAEMPEIAVGQYSDPEPASAGDLAIDQFTGMQQDEKDIGSLVAQAFDSLGTGDRARAVEIFFKALKLNPSPKLAAMLCIEISSVYVAEGRTRQALAVMEMLQEVWGPMLEENDMGRIKTIKIQLRREVQ